MASQAHAMTTLASSTGASRVDAFLMHEGTTAAKAPHKRGNSWSSTSCVLKPVAMPVPMTKADEGGNLPRRIQQLIDNNGGLANIARRCGFSEGTVRNWRDGRSDISRKRCVTLSRVLGISLVWVVCGEGPMESNVNCSGSKGASPSSSDPNEFEAPRRSLIAQRAALDPSLLAAALRLLQSYIGCMGGSLNTSSRANLLAELYEILARVGEPEHVDRLIAFHAKLSGQLRHSSLITVGLT